MKLLFIAVFCHFSILSIGQISSKITDIKIFQNGAQIYRTAKASAKIGTQTITLNGLSPFANKSSVQANIPGVKILDLKYSVNYLESETDNVKVTELKNAIKSIEIEIQKERINKESLELELLLIKSNQNIKGEETLDVEDIKEFLAFYKVRIPELKSKLSDATNQLKKFNTVKTKLKKQLKQAQKTEKASSAKIEITFESKTVKNVEFSFNYHTSRCGWKPLYSLRATDVNSPISLEYAGYIYQNTGVDWNNVSLSLITGNAVEQGNHPQLAVWNLREQNHAYRANVYYKAETNKRKQRLAKEDASVSNSLSSVQSNNMGFSEFKIISKKTILSGETEARVLIETNNLPASYEYYAAPKKSNGVYLLANITGWEKLSLIPGKANIYFDDTYVGHSYINPETSNDTLEVSLGQDQRITVKREKITDKCKTNSFGLSKKHNRAYRITVKNNRNEKVKIRIVDQIPTATNEKIKIELKDNGGAVLNLETGILEWNLEVPANDLSTTSFEFEVKHPRKYNITL